MDHEEKIEVDVLLELQDHMRFTRWVLFKGSRLIPYGSVFLFGVFPLLAFLLTFGSALRAGRQPDWILLLPSVVIAASVVSARIGTKRKFESSKILHETVHYTFSSAGVDNATSTSSGHVAWSNVIRSVETREDFMLFLSLQQAFLIPKRFFPNSEQIDRFRALVARHVQPAPALKRLGGPIKTLLLWIVIFIVVILLWNTFNP